MIGSFTNKLATAGLSRVSRISKCQKPMIINLNQRQLPLSFSTPQKTDLCISQPKRFLSLTPSCRMFIQVEDTPNPNSLKFYPGEPVLESGTADFQDKTQASMRSPLAKALFRIKGVKSVFFSQDFITVTKEDDDQHEWNVLKPQIFSEIMIFYTMGQPILFGEHDSDPNIINENDSDIIKQIKELISERIRPTIQEDGGDLEFVSYEDRIVRVRLQGACTSCPSSIVTLKSGVKNMLQFYIPEIEDVEQINDEA